MQIELIAIAEALSYIKTVDCDKFIILTDSKISIQYLARCTSSMRGSAIAYSILDSILELQSMSKEVHIQWIPSHVNVDGNEQADLLARQACSDGIFLQVVPSFSDCIKLVRQACQNEWREHFNKTSDHKGIWYRTIQPQPTQYPWIDKCTFSRQELVIALRTRSGHIPSRRFTHLMNKSPSPNCENCGVVEDVYHLLMECVRNSGVRRSFSSKTNRMDVGNINSALAYPMGDLARVLYKLILEGIQS